MNNNSKYEEETKHTQWLNASELIEVRRSLCAHKEQEENVVLIVCERHDVSLDE